MLDTYVATHGSGTQTCYYNIEGDEYVDNCIEKAITKCDAGYYLDTESAITDSPDCSPVGQNYYSPAEAITRTPCPTTHPFTESNTTSNIGLCYAECTAVENASEMTGRDYHDSSNGQCSIASCLSGYYMPTDRPGTCEICPAGFYCDTTTGNPEPISCETATAAYADAFTKWNYSPKGSDSIEDCFAQCVERDVENGHATPVRSTENFRNLCEFTGVSIAGNPCKVEELANGVCIESSCRSNYEMKNGRCALCARENATAYETTGNCIIAQCVDGYHPHGDKCESDISTCSIPNATVAQRTWNYTTKTFSMCIVTECATGYHIESNACVPDEQACAMKNGVGTRSWNGNTWDACVATSCDPGYTMDANDQCIECYNKYEENGDQAVSSYVRGCEIASCMYQGEKYQLKNGECIPICTPDSDETGERYWDYDNNECVYNCIGGYTR